MAGCCHVCCKYECRGRNVGYSYLAPERFSMFMWRLPTIVYVCYRIVVALYALVWFFMMVTEFRYNGDDGLALRYEVSLIQMTFTATTLYVVCHAVLAVVMCLRLGHFRALFHLPSCDQHISKFKNMDKDFNVIDEEGMNRQGQTMSGFNQTINNQNEISNCVQHSSQNSEINNMPSSAEDTLQGSGSIYGWLSWYFQIVGVLFQISCNVSVFIFIWYLRGALYISTPENTYHTDNTRVYLQVTGMGFIFTVFDVFTSAIPTRLLHFFYAQVLYIVYLIVYLSQAFTCIKDASVFPVSISFVLMILLCPLPIHLILFGMYHLRCWILKKLYKGQAYYF